jgi:hypothetical protein
MLIKCPECGRDVSDTAPSCPGCGYVLQRQVTVASPVSPRPAISGGAMHCPMCRSDDVIRGATLWEQSTGTVALRSAGVGVGAGGIGVGVAQSQGATASYAATRLAPPTTQKPSPFWLFLILVSLLTGVVTFGEFSESNQPALGGILGLAAIVAGVWGAIWLNQGDIRRTSAANIRATDTWRRLWYCKRCGNVADVDAFRGLAGAPATIAIASNPYASLPSYHDPNAAKAGSRGATS